MESLWIIISIVFAIAFFFSMFGQGGGSIYTPALYLLGYAVLVSVSTSLVLTLLTSVSAGYVFYRHKMIDFKRTLLFIPGIVIGSLTGSLIDNLNLLSTTFLLWLFVAFLIIAGMRMVYSFREKGKAEGACPASFSKRMYALIIAVSFLIGLLSSMLGIGGGIIVVPFMVYICKYPSRWAAGASHVIVAFSALFGVIGHSAFGHLNLTLILSAGAAVLAGGQLGGRIGVRMKTNMMKVGIGVVMWAVAAQVVLKQLGYL
jgi:uncharacterized membrane protein YfcA